VAAWRGRRRRLPVVRILAASTGAVQRPGGEPAPVDPAAQRTGNGRAGQVPLPGGGLMTHALPAAASRQRSLQPTQTARRESRRNAPLVSVS